MKGISTSIGRLLPFFHQSNTHLEIVQVSLPNDIYIVEASATLVLPIAPLALTGALAIWSAISLDADFIQGVTENGPNGLGYCNDLGTSWCNLAYALTATPDSTQPNITHGIPVIAALGARVKTHCRLHSLFLLSKRQLIRYFARFVQPGNEHVGPRALHQWPYGIQHLHEYVGKHFKLHAS